MSVRSPVLFYTFPRSMKCGIVACKKTQFSAVHHLPHHAPLAHTSMRGFSSRQITKTGHLYANLWPLWFVATPFLRRLTLHARTIRVLFVVINTCAGTCMCCAYSQLWIKRLKRRTRQRTCSRCSDWAIVVVLVQAFDGITFPLDINTIVDFEM